MKKNKLVSALTWVCAVLPILLTAAVYEKLPDKIVMNWGFDGTMRYDEKWQLLLVAGLSILMLLLFRVLPKIDPKRRSYEKFRESYQVFQLALMVLLLVMVVVVIVEAFYPRTVNVGMLVTVLIGLFFILMGNMMPKFRHNYFCGIKTPWTLANEHIWNKANRLGGRLFFAAGVLMVPSIFLTEMPRFVIMLVLVAIAAITPCVMSYVWFRREQTEE